ncbi:MAG: methionine adenosyltransferase [Patescibacteria group bacterium]|nr:methionine adenosyltransferase [Patescibacteria group bacterium]
MAEKRLFTSESVTEGHPDKMADQISDAVLDHILKEDPNGRVACEVMVTTGLVLVAGEISTSCYADIPKIARGTIEKIGYNDASYGFDHKACAILSSIDEQSPDISQGVDEGAGLHEEQGAGDQGMMFGFAINETEQLMPLPIYLAHKLTRKLAEIRKAGELDYLRPDGKSQVTVEYEDGKPKRVDAVVISTQHSPEAEHDQIEKDMIEKVIKPVCGEYLDDDTKYHINPTGKFIIGGPPGDCGLTGRKIIVDTYGGMGRHGGGCFSGKDPSKVDRSAAYAARYIAKNIVAAELADKCEVQLAYAIGVADPVSVLVDTFETGKVDADKLSGAVREIFPLKPGKIISALDLKRPIYKQTAAYGHFGRDDLDLPWEKTDKVDELKKLT